MHYWNKDNFDGLRSVGEKYTSTDGYELFGQYCLQKEKGLKKLAVSSIKKFVSEVEILPDKEQIEIADELSALCFYNGNIHQLLSHPLAVLLKHILTQWASSEPNNAIPHKWLGYISGDIELFEKALLLDPKDEDCIKRILSAHLNDVDYQTHHLSESLFIGDLRDAEHSLSEALSLIHRLTTQELKEHMQEEFAYYERIVNSWKKYSSLKIVDSFPKWCESKGEKFNFWSIVYYN